MARPWKPSVTVAAVVERDGRFLLVEEETPEGIRLNQPAGHLDPGESLIDAAVREALEELRAERGSQPIALIMGMDAFAGLDRWHRAADLIRLAHLVVAIRPKAPVPGEGLAATLLREHRCEDPARLSESAAGLVYVSRGTQLDLSSSAVRSVVAAGRDPRYLMPEAARRIILARGSYARSGEIKE